MVIEAMDGGGRGHLGSAMSLIEIMRVLYDDVAHHRPDEPDWSGRDRVILSKGHGCLALYAILADHGYFPRNELKTFCHQISFLGGHPEMGKVPGVEASTGALGHGLAIGTGMAMAAKIENRDTRVLVVMGDGEINEGAIWEAAMHAAKHGLCNLVAIVDYNKIQQSGHVHDVLGLEPLADKWRAFGWSVRELDGHDMAEITAALDALPFAPDRPSLIIAHTVKGKGVSFAEDSHLWHQNTVDDEIYRKALDELGEPV